MPLCVVHCVPPNHHVEFSCETTFLLVSPKGHFENNHSENMKTYCIFKNLWFPDNSNQVQLLLIQHLRLTHDKLTTNSKAASSCFKCPLKQLETLFINIYSISTNKNKVFKLIITINSKQDILLWLVYAHAFYLRVILIYSK